jgi:hypothetical protein
MTSPLELVKRRYQNVSSANFDGEDELFSPDVETIDPGAGTLHGIEAFKGYEAAFQRAFPDGKLVLKSAIEAGNKVAVEGAYTGTHTGPLTVPAARSRPPSARSTWISQTCSRPTAIASRATAFITTRSSS